MTRYLAIVLFVAIGVALTGCGKNQQRAPGHGVYMLIDTSGTYTRELKKAQQIINVTLAKLYPGDTFAVARIDTGSFSEKDIVAKVTFDDRPSMANHQKRLFKEKIDKFVTTVEPARYTDITGGILQGTQFLNEKGTGRKTILIFSDLKEELGEGYNRDIAFALKGFDVVAINVTKLRSDNYDPEQYMDRLERWEARVVSAGGTWTVINDMDQMEKIFT
jgi:hypothetical protein